MKYAVLAPEPILDISIPSVAEAVASTGLESDPERPDGAWTRPVRRTGPAAMVERHLRNADCARDRQQLFASDTEDAEALEVRRPVGAERESPR